MLQDNIDKMYNPGPELASTLNRTGFNREHSQSGDFRSTNDQLLIPNLDPDADDYANASRQHHDK